MLDKIVITGGITVEGGNLLGSVGYLQNVNPTESLGVGFAVSARIKFTTTVQISEGDELTFYTQGASDATWRKIGVFYADTVKVNGSLFTVTAYDAVYSKTLGKMGITLQPTTTEAAITSLITALGLTVGTLEGNASAQIVCTNTNRLFSAREVLGYIAAVMGGYVYADANGAISVRCLNTTLSGKTALTSSNTVKVNVSDKHHLFNQSVRYQDCEGWKSYGLENDSINIAGNPLFTDAPASYCLTNAGAIYNSLKTKITTYYTGTVTLLDDYGIKAGDCITVNGKNFIVFCKSVTDDGVVLSSSWAPSMPTSVENIAELYGGKEDKHALIKSAGTLYEWGNTYRKGSGLSLNLPEPKDITPDRLRVFFKGNGNNATVNAPSGYKLAISDFRSVAAGNTLNIATVSGYIYLFDFEVVYNNRIKLTVTEMGDN